MNLRSYLKQVNLGLLYTLLSALIIAIGTIMAIQYAKGNYRFTQDGFVKETGLLSANSSPTGAQVLINGSLVTATDDTLYLEPGNYQIKIIKDGYSPWEKTLSIEKELVAQTNALLFPNAPSLTPLTFTGAENVSPSPDGQKIIYYTASASASTKNGLYAMDLSGNLFPLQRSDQQLAEDVPSWNLNQAHFIWSPDSTQVMVIANGHHVLLETNKKQSLKALTDVSINRKQILSQWEAEIYLRERQFLAKFPEEIIQYATQSAKNVYLSPDKKKLLYTSLAEHSLPDDIIPPVPATNTQTEERTLQPDNIYVYDSEEDKNFRIGQEEAQENQADHQLKQLLAIDLSNPTPISYDASPSAFVKLQANTLAKTADNFRSYYASLYSNSHQWLPGSQHIIHTEGNTIKIMEYDRTNDTTIYSGPFIENFTYPSPDGNKLVILTTFSPNSPSNLYAVELKR
jgi:hypothetical protein